LWGYTPPVITSINGGAAITDGQTGIALVGTDLIDSVGNPALWLCSTNDFATAPIKVAQTVTGTPADTGIDFTVVHGGLSAGPVYAFVVSALGQVSAPLAVTLDPSGPPPEFIAGVEEIIISTASVAANTLSLIKITPALGGYAEQIRVFSKVDSNVIGVLYSDVLGEPGDLLAVSASVLATAEEWTVLAIDSTRIHQVDYWVGAISDTMGGVSRQSIAGYVSRRKSVSFAGFIPPDPAGSGYTADTIAYSLAVYGVLDATDPLIGTLKKIMLFGSILEPTEIMSLHNRAMGEF
jgi:hypothetical protein